MKRFIALCTATLFFGCASAEIPQTQGTTLDTQTVEDAYVVCKSRVDSNPEAVRLTKSFVLGQNKNDHYLEKTANESYVTDDQVFDLYSYHNKLDICREKVVEGLQAIDKEYATLVSNYFSEDDKITDAVVNKEITIGEANRKVTISEYVFSLKGYAMKEQRPQSHRLLAHPLRLVQKRPAVKIQVDPLLVIKTNPFELKQITLQNIATAISARTDHALTIDDPLPWDLVANGQSCQSKADGACGTANLASNLTVTGDITGRNLLDQGIDALVEHADLLSR